MMNGCGCVFDKVYGALCKLVDEEGGLKPPDNDDVNEENLRLASWLLRLDRQRSGAMKFAAGHEEQVKTLLEYFDRTNKAVKNDWIWNGHFYDLLEYKRSHHTFTISKKDKIHSILRGWVIRQREKEKDGSLHPHRKDRMVKAGVDFHPYASLERKRKYTAGQEERWQQKYEMLIDFKDRHGHCNVCYYDKANPDLAKWVVDQRVAYRKGKMDEHRKELLASVGFIWNIRKKPKLLQS
jgi:hypothetical protein